MILDIIKKANKKILIIDNYIDDNVLKMLTKKKKAVEVVILTSDKSNINNLDIKKFNKEMYHLGASIKDLGKKCFGVNKIEDMEIIEKIINV